MKSSTSYIAKLTELEHDLERALEPVSPDPGFVADLNHKLHSREPFIPREKSWAAAYLLCSFGLFIGVFLFWLARKIMRANKRAG
jgi:hypothetical protein